MNKILITGATGHLGNAVIDTLLRKVLPENISVISRKPEKVKELELKGFRAYLGSYENLPSLEIAMETVDTVLLISAGDAGNRMQEHRNVIDTAKKMGVECIAYTGRCLRDRNLLVNTLMKEHFATEDYIRESGLSYTIFRNILYMDTIPQFIGDNAALDKGIFLPAGNGKVSFALRAEMGQAIANVLMQESCADNIYNFTGSELYSFHDVAAVLTQLSGKQINYSDIDKVNFEEMMKQKKLPDAVITKITGFITDVKNNQEATISRDLEIKLGRKPTALKEGLKALFNL